MSDITSALRARATHRVKDDEVEYVAELLIAVYEDNDSAGAELLAPLLTESLEDVTWLDPTNLKDISMALARVLTGEFERDSDEDEPTVEEKVRAAMKNEYAIDKSCLAVLEEDGEWHPARIKNHVEDNSVNTDADWLSLEVEFIEFGKKQVVKLEEVVLDEDVADDGDDEDQQGRCEMCMREMKLTFHHLTPRDVHAKYLKMGYSREFLNTGVMICRPCHSKIHSSENNKTLARDYNTLAKIMTHPQIIRWVNYAKKQRSTFKPEKKSKWPVGK